MDANRYIRNGSRVLFIPILSCTLNAASSFFNCIFCLKENCKIIVMRFQSRLVWNLQSLRLPNLRCSTCTVFKKGLPPTQCPPSNGFPCIDDTRRCHLIAGEHESAVTIIECTNGRGCGRYCDNIADCEDHSDENICC